MSSLDTAVGRLGDRPRAGSIAAGYPRRDEEHTPLAKDTTVGGFVYLSNPRYERDLYEPLRQHFCECGFEVRAEVNSCDLVAVKADLVIIVEIKRHLSFDLVAQAVERQSYADAVYIAIPKPDRFQLNKQWRAKLRVLRQLGLGLLFVGATRQRAAIEEALVPGTARPLRLSPHKRRALDVEFRSRRLDLNTGGSSGVPLVTAYREVALYLVYLLATRGPMTSKALRGLGAHPKKTAGILRANHYGWFGKAEGDCYELTDAGREALAVYRPLIDLFAAEATTKPGADGQHG